MTDERRTAAIIITIFVGVAGLAFGGIHMHGQSEAGPGCYEDFRNTYTWPYAQKELDGMWADRLITVDECTRIGEVNLEARQDDARTKTNEDYRSYHEAN